MKHNILSGTTNLHPALAFHQEVLSISKWIAIRDEFMEVLSNPYNRITWNEKDKLWRHSREALGKWVLSQVARCKVNDVPGGFFSFIVKPVSNPNGKEDFDKFILKLPSELYNEQLIRDLSLKSDGAHKPVVIGRIKDLLNDFDLYGRCFSAYKSVQEQLVGLNSSTSDIYAPDLRKVSEDNNSRSNYQKRIQGLVAQITAVRPRGSQMRKEYPPCPSASIPWVVWDKLFRSYEVFGPAFDGHYFASFSRDQCFTYRAATAALRYEVGLFTGSLQLCADVALKRHLDFRGYHVIDLCSSPINAYMDFPQMGSFRPKVDSSSGAPAPRLTQEGCLNHDKKVIVPNRFCSAFYDTDSYFGSIGNALNVDSASLYDLCSEVNLPQRPLLLTLDVPYDEDICELLFQKLAKDIQNIAAAKEIKLSVDYLLVIPLWWDVPMLIKKHIFMDDASELPKERGEVTSDKEKFLANIIAEHSAVLNQGYRVTQNWTETLGAATRGVSQTSNQSTDDSWVVFDGVFFGKSYPYFCASTNRPLRGVTMTEVIGLRQPRSSDKGGLLLKEVLHEFYDI
ncbi:unnamed protein product [Phytomonas sp. Hart1]|nr:unnamed protein product [Phytomonas sp. Hart1]|eukprot:CCW65930.1 unnamed protein product [Phytomonas sp. isolate Hart1]